MMSLIASMTDKQKKLLYRIIAAAIMMAVLIILPLKQYPLLRFVLFLIPYYTVGHDILRKAVKGIRNRQVFDENFLMAAATVGAMALGEYTEGVAVMLFYQIGELFQSCAVGRSRQNISSLMDIRPDYANLVTEDGIEKTDPDDVEVGSMILIQPGERVPIDGVVEEGTSALDTSALTGESMPRDIGPGQEILSGSINLSGLLRVRTTKEFDESTASRILDLVENAGSRKAKSEQFITKFARWYTPFVCYSALALAVLGPLVSMAALHKPGGWPLWSDWTYRALTFLVISCPCAIVVSVPLTFFGGIGGAGSRGILIKGSNFMETLSEVRTIVFDKTGTLTKGNFAVTKICPAESSESPESQKDPESQEGMQVPESEDSQKRPVSPVSKDPSRRLLEYAALAESYSSHPISKSLQQAFREMQAEAAETGAAENAEAAPADKAEAVLSAPNGTAGSKVSLPSDEAAGESPEKGGRGSARVGSSEEISGKGVLTEVDGCRVAVGNARLMQEMGITFPQETLEMAGTIVHVAAGTAYLGYIVISDEIKEGSASAIRALQESGVSKTVMLTGDTERTAEAVASQLGISQYHARLLPADKVAMVEKLLEENASSSKKGSLAFVGDGINDAPVLSRADIGIAMGALGSDAAIEAADVVLMDDDPGKIPEAVRLARKCIRIVKENIWFAIGVKILCLLLGAAGIANMWLAIFADVGVMVLCVLNAVRALV